MFLFFFYISLLPLPQLDLSVDRGIWDMGRRNTTSQLFSLSGSSDGRTDGFRLAIAAATTQHKPTQTGNEQRGDDDDEEAGLEHPASKHKHSSLSLSLSSIPFFFSFVESNNDTNRPTWHTRGGMKKLVLGWTKKHGLLRGVGFYSRQTFLRLMIDDLHNLKKRRTGLFLLTQKGTQSGKILDNTHTQHTR